jgi:hypothetical protein
VPTIDFDFVSPNQNGDSFFSKKRERERNRKLMHILIETRKAEPNKQTKKGNGKGQRDKVNNEM